MSTGRSGQAPSPQKIRRLLRRFLRRILIERWAALLLEHWLVQRRAEDWASGSLLTEKVDKGSAAGKEGIGGYWRSERWTEGNVKDQMPLPL